jgi:hypothetical protein
MALCLLVLPFCCTFAPVLLDPSSPPSGVVWSYIQDLRINFGIRSGGHWQYRVVMFIIFLVAALAPLIDLVFDLVVMTDDFLLVADPASAAPALALLRHVNSAVGHGLAGKHVDGFGLVSDWRSSTVWAGVVYSTVLPPSKRVPPGYLDYVLTRLDAWEAGSLLSRSEIRSFQGTLIWVCSITSGLRPIIAPLLDLTRSAVGSSSAAPFRLPASATLILADIRSFLTRFRSYPVSRLIRSRRLPAAPWLALFSDSQPGSHGLPALGGVFIAGFYASFEFPPSVLARASVTGRLDNNVLELHTALVALIMACWLFPDVLLDGTFLLSVVDSSAALGAFYSHRAANSEATRLLRLAHLLSGLSDFQFSLVDRPSVRVLSADMLFADPLSRRAWARFWAELDPLDPSGSFTSPLTIPPAVLCLDSLDDLLTFLASPPPDGVAARLLFWRDRLRPLVVPASAH